jgi:chromate transporter
VGYQVGGIPGGLVATVAIFTPGFAAVAVADRLLPRVRSSRPASAALDAVVAASLGLMAAALARIAATALTDWLTWTLGIASASVLLWRRPNTAWLVAAGAAVGLAHGALT